MRGASGSSPGPAQGFLNQVQDRLPKHGTGSSIKFRAGSASSNQDKRPGGERGVLPGKDCHPPPGSVSQLREWIPLIPTFSRQERRSKCRLGHLLRQAQDRLPAMYRGIECGVCGQGEDLMQPPLDAACPVRDPHLNPLPPRERTSCSPFLTPGAFCTRATPESFPSSGGGPSTAPSWCRRGFGGGYFSPTPS